MKGLFNRMIEAIIRHYVIRDITKAVGYVQGARRGGTLCYDCPDKALEHLRLAEENLRCARHLTRTN